MKFLCDRCKTRYSIGDDRVRGKILKIRCKNCANVITVREGMEATDAAPEPEQHAPAPSPPAAARTGRPTTMSPPPAATVPAAKPPAALDEEWYVSIEGEQSGPFSLTEAQKWISAKPFDAELHCWSEGFDDWLPVDKVSHFRGIRKKPAPAQPPKTPPPRAPTRQVPIIKPQEDEPKPLFAATMAAIERSVPTAMPATARATPSGGVPRMNGAGSGPAAAAKGTGAAAIPGAANLPRAKSSADSERLRTEPDRLPSHADVNNAPTKVGDAAFPDEPPARAPISAPISAPVKPMFPTPVSAPVQAKPLPAPMPAPLPLPAPMPLPAPTPAAIAEPAPPPPAQRADSEADEDDMEIGEVSRVVNLADLMKARPQPAKERAATQPGPAMRRSQPVVGARTGSVNRLDPNSLGLGAALGQTSPGGPPLLSPDAMADAGQPSVFVPTPAPVRSQRSLVILLLAAIVLLGGVAAVVIVVLKNTDDDAIDIGLGPTTDQIDTTRPEDQVRHNPLLPPPIPGIGSSGGSTPHPNNPNTNPIHRPNPQGGSGGNSGTTTNNGGKVENDPLGATTALKPDEVEDMSAKQSGGETRCWERALRKQPYLQKDVKKVAITITVDALGGVSNVQIAGMPADDGNLGNCLQAFIHSWKFRQSSAGITAKFSMVFQN